MITELEIIEHYFKKLIDNHASFNLQADIARVTSDHQIIINTDSLIEGIHFFSKDSPSSIAHRLIHTNLSDLAVTGATPRYWSLAINLPIDCTLFSYQWMDEFTNYLNYMQNLHGFRLIGGNTNFSHNKLWFVATFYGELLAEHQVVTHRNCNDEDLIFVSNEIGDSFFGLQILKSNYFGFKDHYNHLSKEDKNYLIKKYQYPLAQTHLGKLIVKYATAATDISDGLLSDLRKICVASGVYATIHLEYIPVSKVVSKLLPKLDVQKFKMSFINQGGDYELLFTIPKKYQKIFMQKAKEENIIVTQIGYMQSSKELPFEAVQVYYDNKPIGI